MSQHFLKQIPSIYLLGAQASPPWQFQASYGTQGDLFVCQSLRLLAALQSLQALRAGS